VGGVVDAASADPPVRVIGGGIYPRRPAPPNLVPQHLRDGPKRGTGPAGDAKVTER